MPRLNTSAYIKLHHDLRQLWLRDLGDFGVLVAADQWDLHGYFACSMSLTDAELVVHRRKITEHDPSLPQRAGKVYNRLLRELDRRDAYVATSRAQVTREQEVGLAVTAGSSGRKSRIKGGQKKRMNRDRIISVHSVVHPEPETEKFARALLEMAKEMQRSDRASRIAREQTEHGHHDASSSIGRLAS